VGPTFQSVIPGLADGLDKLESLSHMLFQQLGTLGRPFRQVGDPPYYVNGQNSKSQP
jgi:hypothetical protein